MSTIHLCQVVPYIMDYAAFLKLEGVCLEVLNILRTIPELQTEKVAVIGGLAMCKHLLPLFCRSTPVGEF